MAKLLMLTAAAVGVSAAAATLGMFFVALKVVGAVYLVFLGVRMWRRSPAEVPPGAASTGAGPFRAAATGLALGLSNPQAIIFYVALLPAVIKPGTGAGVYVGLAVVLCVVMAAVSAAYITLGSRARRAAVNPTGRRRANRVAGGLLLVSGVLVGIR